VDATSIQVVAIGLQVALAVGWPVAVLLAR
jgi:hypothetical protein